MIMNFKNLKPLYLAALGIGLTACGDVKRNVSDIVIYPANIITIDPDMPNATAVAVENGRIIAVDNFESMNSYLSGAAIDNRFSNKTIMPGLIDPHIHMVLGSMMYGLDFVPPWDMETPAGTVKGLPNKALLMSKIAEFESAAPDGPLILYGYHNLVQGDLTRQDLDTISTTRPIYIWHFSGHDFYLNSAAIKNSKLTPALADKYHGIGLDDKGELNGRIFEDAALALFATIGPILLAPDHIKKGWEGYEAIFARSGVTTVAEMGYGIFGRALEDNYTKAYYSDADNYRLYQVPEHRAFSREFGAEAVIIRRL